MTCDGQATPARDPSGNGNGVHAKPTRAWNTFKYLERARSHLHAPMSGRLVAKCAVTLDSLHDPECHHVQRLQSETRGGTTYTNDMDRMPTTSRSHINARSRGRETTSNPRLCCGYMFQLRHATADGRAGTLCNTVGFPIKRGEL